MKNKNLLTQNTKMKKYRLRDDLTIVAYGVTLYRVEYLIDSRYFSKGELGGYIEKESNLDQEGDAHVSGNAHVFGNAQVSGDAWVFGNAWVYGDAQVYGNAWVYGDAHVYGNAQVSGDAWVFGNAQVSGDAWVFGNAQVSGNAQVYGNAQVSFYIELNKTEQLINLIGLKYNITITYCYAQVGCKFFMLDELEAITYDSVKNEITECEFHTMKHLINISLESILSKI